MKYPNPYYSFDPKKKKKILAGGRVGDTFFKHVETKHYMRKIDGYGIQSDVFQQLVDDKVLRICIKEIDTGKNWETTIMNWQSHSKTADYGHGKQVFLSLKYMKPYDANTQYPNRHVSQNPPGQKI